ncbi:GtrA family protein [Halodesulfurarchaeum sp. HSR-GB]|uniref:GtrA family protein n=1 Tax=Halodesulfurarchaeum sp. HSR-GB TaxID=3074077 RepID=UPI0028611282|nr:GtrA family protein [Halodesulfurarchaeum sp. HSR-GB]MDR5657229.1 GtrA family protein [Halodesulfurarchaeum sp. HSR-GB]
MLRSFLRGLHSGPVAEQLRRFVIVGTVAAGIQLLVLWLLVDAVGLNYLLGAVIAIEFTILFQYVLNNAWTFEAAKNTGRREYYAGLVKTNLVRGSAIPLQLGVLFVLVEFAAIPYLLANAVAILVSGVYRFYLDARWTWGQ